MGFWEAATEQAGREFGARHYRWFAGVRVARRVAPVVSILVIAGSVVLGGSWAYRAVDPQWGQIGERATGWADEAGNVALWLGAAAGLLVIVTIGVLILRRVDWWRWWMLHRPVRMRRY